MGDRIYLDHHATTPTDPEVLDAMLPYFAGRFGNPASVTHAHGREASEAVERARAEVAALIGAEDPAEIVFTSCATESNNLAIKGSAWALRERGAHVVTSAIEHPSVLEPCRWLAGEGFRITETRPDGEGRIDPSAVGEALEGGAVLASIAWANGEMGAIQPVEEIARLCAARGVRFHTDATQAVGRVPVDVGRVGCAALSLSGHKIYGPKGVGALFVRRRHRLAPLLSGGGQEKGRRSGTLNVPGIVGLGAACRLAGERLASDQVRMASLRDRLLRGLLDRIPGIAVNGPAAERLAGNLNVSFEDLDGQALIEQTPELCLSSGSACAAGSTDPSPVLVAMGISPERALGSVRFGIGRGNTERDIDRAVEQLAGAAARLRSISTRSGRG